MAGKVRNAVAAAREARQWSQAELAGRSGLSRPEISAIETGRVTPAVTAALALARAFDCSVETLFQAAGGINPQPAVGPAWAVDPPALPRGRAAKTASRSDPVRYWAAAIAGRIWLYPTEPTLLGLLPHDGVAAVAGADLPPPRLSLTVTARAADTLVIATCDPAVGALAAVLRAQTHDRLRLLPLMRSSAAAVALLARGQAHAAGVHMAAADRPADNLTFARRVAGSPDLQLLQVADWQTGVVLRDAGRFGSAAAAARARLSWVGREKGAGARRCLDDLLGTDRRYAHLAPDHTAVAVAVRDGFADAGVCPQLTAAETRLAFLPVHREAYALCLAADPRADWRLRALQAALQSPAYRALLGDLPGCRASAAGQALV